MAMSLTRAPEGAGSRDLPVLGVSLPLGDREGYCLCSSAAGEDEGEGKEKGGRTWPPWDLNPSLPPEEQE